MYLLKEHPYRFLFYSGIINGMGDRFSQVAVLTLLLQLTGSGIAVGAALGIRVLPYLLLPPLAGKWADRWNKKFLLMLADFLRIPFALSFLFIESEEQVWLIFIGMTALTCGEACYQPIRKSVISATAEKAHLQQVNGWEQFLLGTVLIGGSVTGGLVAYGLGSSYAFVLNGCSFLLASLCLLPMKMKDKETSYVTKPTKATFRWEKWLVTAAVILFISAAMDGIFNVMISVYAVELFQLDELGVGLLYGGLGTGLMLSFFLSNKIKGPLILLCIGLLIIEGTMQMIASQMTSFFPLVVSFLSVALLGGISGALLDTFVMKYVNEDNHGHVFGRIESLTNVQLGLMMFLTGVMLEQQPARTVGPWGGMVGVGGGVVMLGIYLVLQKREANKKRVLLNKRK